MGRPCPSARGALDHPKMQAFWGPVYDNISTKRASGDASASARGVGALDYPKEQALWGPR
jgi:hypothetical protein